MRIGLDFSNWQAGWDVIVKQSATLHSTDRIIHQPRLSLSLCN